MECFISMKCTVQLDCWMKAGSCVKPGVGVNWTRGECCIHPLTEELMSNKQNTLLTSSFTTRDWSALMWVYFFLHALTVIRPRAITDKAPKKCEMWQNTCGHIKCSGTVFQADKEQESNDLDLRWQKLSKTAAQLEHKPWECEKKNKKNKQQMT